MRALVFFFIFAGTAAMALERPLTNFGMGLPPSPKEPSKDDMWQSSPEKADINRLEQMVARGEITREQAVQIFRQKWTPGEPAPRPNVPLNPNFSVKWR